MNKNFIQSTLSHRLHSTSGSVFVLAQFSMCYLFNFLFLNSFVPQVKICMCVYMYTHIYFRFAMVLEL